MPRLGTILAWRGRLGLPHIPDCPRHPPRLPLAWGLPSVNPLLPPCTPSCCQLLSNDFAIQQCHHFCSRAGKKEAICPFVIALHLAWISAVRRWHFLVARRCLDMYCNIYLSQRHRAILSAFSDVRLLVLTRDLGNLIANFLTMRSWRGLSLAEWHLEFFFFFKKKKRSAKTANGPLPTSTDIDTRAAADPYEYLLSGDDRVAST